MSVTLGYVSSEAVSDQARAAISADAKRVSAGRRWWCEGIHFVDAVRENEPLCGATRLLILGYSTRGGGYVEIEPAEDMFMAARDARTIMEQLARWSLEHAVSWQVGIEGADPVPIEQGRIDPSLTELVDSLLAMAGEQGLGVADEAALAAKIDAKYASRWE